MSCFQKALTEYLGGRKRDPWYTRLWLKYMCSQEYLTRRDKVLFKLAQARSERLFRNMLRKTNPLLALIPKRDAWTGAILPVPFICDAPAPEAVELSPVPRSRPARLAAAIKKSAHRFFVRSESSDGLPR